MWYSGPLAFNYFTPFWLSLVLTRNHFRHIKSICISWTSFQSFERSVQQISDLNKKKKSLILIYWRFTCVNMKEFYTWIIYRVLLLPSAMIIVRKSTKHIKILPLYWWNKEISHRHNPEGRQELVKDSDRAAKANMFFKESIF